MVKEGSPSRIVGALSAFCRQHPLDEKWLLAPSLRIGYQWLDRVALAGQPLANLHVKTIRSMAFDLAAPVLSERGLLAATNRRCLLVAGQALDRLRGSLGYLKAKDERRSLPEALLRTIQSLRLAGLGPEDLGKGAFEHSLKSRDLAALLASYRQILGEKGLADYGDLLEMAAAEIRGEGTGRSPVESWFLVPADLELAFREKTMLHSLERGMLFELPVDEPASLSEGDLEVSTASAVGEVNEVRSVLRTCLSRGIPLDRAEILYSDSDTYVPLIHEVFASLDREAEGREGGPPFTSAEGIPCSYSRPGRALDRWLKWRDRDFPQERLVRMIREGLLKTGQDERKIASPRMADLLGRLPIGFGRERYGKIVGEKIKHLESRRSAGGPSSSDLPGFRTLEELLARLLSFTPARTAAPAEKVAAARGFIDSCAVSRSRLDAFAARKLGEELSAMERLLEEEGERGGIDVEEWLGELPGATRVLGSGPRPGRLHIDHLRHGGHSGRPYTFVLGLDDGRFPGSGGQDPLLLDGERRSLSGELPTSADRLDASSEGFYRLLARLRGEAHLIFSRRDVTEDRDMFPSSVLLDSVDSGPGASSPGVGPFLSPHSFAPSEEEWSLSSTEWWMWRMTGGGTVNRGRELVEGFFPHLGRGRMARESRHDRAFTAWDGNVPAAGEDLEPTGSRGHVLSANALQTAGACPLRYFFRYGLAVEAPPDFGVTPGRWLDPLARGALLHELFEEFMKTLLREDRRPEFERDRPKMGEILEELVARYWELYPPPLESAFVRERRFLELAADTFLKEEERFFEESGNSPLFLEASLGLPPGGTNGAFDTDEPLSLPLPGGRVIRCRGRIDRIDAMGGEEGDCYGIWDYKTGGSRGYSRSDPCRQGRVIQPWLYTAMVENRLREAVSRKARVGMFGYFFPGHGAAGERITWTPQELHEGGKVVEDLCSVIAAGAFVATTDSDEDCRFCDYRIICGEEADLKGLSAAAKEKILSGENPSLEPQRRLRFGK
jgi:hypothetical protein